MLDKSIEWVPTDKGHNVEMLAGLSGYDLPKKTKLNNPVSMTFTMFLAFISINVLPMQH